MAVLGGQLGVMCLEPFAEKFSEYLAYHSPPSPPPSLSPIPHLLSLSLSPPIPLSGAGKPGGS